MALHLTAVGKKRAELLPELFVKSERRPDPFPRPDFLFAAKNSKSSHRSVETATPLAEKLKLTLHAEVKNEDYGTLAKDLLGGAKFSGKTILVAWHHGKLPDFARARPRARGRSDDLGVEVVRSRLGDHVFGRQGDVPRSAASALLFRTTPLMAPHRLTARTTPPVIGGHAARTPSPSMKGESSSLPRQIPNQSLRGLVKGTMDVGGRSLAASTATNPAWFSPRRSVSRRISGAENHAAPLAALLVLGRLRFRVASVKYLAMALAAAAAATSGATFYPARSSAARPPSEAAGLAGLDDPERSMPFGTLLRLRLDDLLLLRLTTGEADQFTRGLADRPDQPPTRCDPVSLFKPVTPFVPRSSPFSALRGTEDPRISGIPMFA